MSNITSTGFVKTLSGSGGGGLVGPTPGGNIELVAGAGIAITGNQAAHTITISNTGAEASTFNADVGTATPVAGVVNILGDAGAYLGTTASGNTLRVNIVGADEFAVQIGDNNGSLTNTNVGNDGQILIGSSSGGPLFADLTSSDGSITFTAGSNSLDLSVSGGGISWSTVAINTQMIVDHGYAVDSNGATRVMTLPQFANVGATIKILDIGTANNGWLIAQNAGQQIVSAIGLASTAGVAGSLFPTIDSAASDVNFAAVTLVCAIEDTLWVVDSANCVLDVT